MFPSLNLRDLIEGRATTSTFPCECFIIPGFDFNTSGLLKGTLTYCFHKYSETYA